MKKNKVLSLFLALIMVFTCTFYGISDAAQVGTVRKNKNIGVKQSQGVNETKESSAYKPSSIKSGNYMYYSVYNTIYKVNVKTRKSTIVYKSKSGYWFSDLNVKDGWIYCVMDKFMVEGARYTYIFKVKTNGKNSKILKKGIKPIVYKDKIYYIKCYFNENYDYDDPIYLGIYKMSLSGKNDKCVVDSEEVDNFTVYKSNVYYSTPEYYSYGSECMKGYSDYIYFNYNNDIYKSSINTGEMKKVVSNATLKDLSGGYIYYTTTKYDGDRLYKMKISNKAKTFIKKHAYPGIGDVTVEGGYIIMTLNYELSYENQTCTNAKYFCNTNGKKGKILKRYYQS